MLDVPRIAHPARFAVGCLIWMLPLIPQSALATQAPGPPNHFLAGPSPVGCCLTSAGTPADGAWFDLRGPVTQNAATVYDSRRRRIVQVFGFGALAYSVPTLTNAAWSLALDPGASWQPIVAAGNSPAPRLGAPRVCDFPRDRPASFAPAP